MASTILYKFRSSTTFEALPLPGASARLFDVKKGIVKAKRLESGMDFELEVHDATTNQQYVDESMLLPRGTRLIVHRVGAARGQGFVARMQRAESGMMSNAPLAASTPSGYYTIESHGDDEDEFVTSNRGADERELAALMAATETPQNPMTGTRPTGGASGYRPAGSGPPSQARPGGNFPSRQQNFRPNADPELRAQEQQGMPKKRATGIPRTFLNLSAPPATDGAFGEGESENIPRLQPNALGFEELVNRGGGQSGNTTGTRRDLDYALKLTATTIPEHLQCGICHSVAKNAMLLPWDLEGRTACETCIRDALTQNGFRCPLTGNEGVSPDDLFPNMPLRKAVDHFVQGVMEKMEDIVKQQVDEPDEDEEAAISSKDFEGDTGDKGVIVSKKTIKEHRSKRHDDDDPFGGGDDDFGGDVFAVEAPVPEEPEQDEMKVGEKVVGKGNDNKNSKNLGSAETNPPLSIEKAAEAPTQSIDDNKTEQAKDVVLAPERRKQRALPAGYAMGPAGGATGPAGGVSGPPTPNGAPNRHDDAHNNGDFRGRGRGGRGMDRGGYRGSGRGGRGGRFGGRGRYDEYDGGRGTYHARDQGYVVGDRGHEVSAFYACLLSSEFEFLLAFMSVASPFRGVQMILFWNHPVIFRRNPILVI
jgi:hypothetical protein